jgi:5-methyltetrahydrofolate--homocysteine methyltransferase
MPMNYERIEHRLVQGRPLVVGADVGASFRAKGISLGAPGELSLLLRRTPEDVLNHYRTEVACRVDVLCALTADTAPRALAEVGMQHRSAMLTGVAVELALSAAAESQKPVVVAGLLGSDMVAPLAADRLHEELVEHAERLAAAGCELIIARGQGSHLGLMAAVVAAAGTDLPTWAVIECRSSAELKALGPVAPLIEGLQGAGATVVIFEVPEVDLGIEMLERSQASVSSEGLFPGVLLAASAESVRGFPDDECAPAHWAERALDLDVHGARIIGGGAGTTEAHSAALAHALGFVHPSLPSTRSDTELDQSPPGI